MTVLTRHEVSKDAELLVFRHENPVLRRQVGRVRYEPGDRLCLAATAAATCRPRPLLHTKRACVGGLINEYRLVA